MLYVFYNIISKYLRKFERILYVKWNVQEVSLNSFSEYIIF